MDQSASTRNASVEGAGAPEAAPRTDIGFILLVALTMSLVAMSIDTMLPALGIIASELGAKTPNDRQLVLTAFFGGLTVGQLVFGPLSDSTGRKPALFAGIALFIAGGLICSTTSHFGTLVWARLLQGFGAAGPRIVANAMVRDLHAGRAMARVMSFASTVFILVPVLAPAMGQAGLSFASWRAIFGLLVIAGLVDLLWFAARKETLPPERRIPFSLGNILRAGRETLTQRVTLGYTLASGFVFAALIAYLTTSQQIFQEQYGLGERFPLYFGMLAVSIGVASFVNAKLVMRFGMRVLSRGAVLCTTGLSTLFLGFTLLQGGHPPLALFMLYMVPCFFCNGLLFGNYNARAMEPVGHIAGAASAISGSVASLLALGLGAAFAHAYDGTVRPLITGYAVFGFLAFIATELAERRVEPRLEEHQT